MGMRELLTAARNASDWPQQRWYLTEFHRRIAMAFACFVLALVGIPLGISAKKGGKATGFVLTIILVFAYYFTSLGCITLARTRKLPVELGVWLSNIAFFAIGVVLLWRVDRMPLEVSSLKGTTQRLRSWFRTLIYRSGTARDVHERIKRRRWSGIEF